MYQILNMPKDSISIVSGGFDPLHIGHIRMIDCAYVHCSKKVIVILNNDNWLKKKKGYVFMPERERAEMLTALPQVEKVIISGHEVDSEDMSVSKELKKIFEEETRDIQFQFCNGGDRNKNNVPSSEEEVCNLYGAITLYGMGGEKKQSSSILVDSAIENRVTTERPWGNFKRWTGDDTWTLKTLNVKPSQAISLQYHLNRDEMWTVVSGRCTVIYGRNVNTLKQKELGVGDTFKVKRGYLHRVQCTLEGATIVEVSFGRFDEQDIVRIKDKYGRL